jgi:hypothetical protein
MSKSSTDIRPAAAPRRVTTHPGEVLAEEFLLPLGLSANALALALRVPRYAHRLDFEGRTRGQRGYCASSSALFWDEPGNLAGASIQPRPD